MAHKTFMSFLSLCFVTILDLSRASTRTAAGTFVDRATQFISITGSTTGENVQTNARPFRLNILDLQNDQPSWYAIIRCHLGESSQSLIDLAPQVPVYPMSLPNAECK